MKFSENNKLVLRLALHGKGLYLLLLFAFPILVIPEAMTGLVAKATFDILQGAESVSLVLDWSTFSVGQSNEEKIKTVLWIVCGLIFLRIIMIGPLILGYYWLVRLQYLVTPLLQRNMLDSIYRKPGAEKLPTSPGDIISRFRGDAGQVYSFIFSTQAMASNLIIGTCALTLLLSVNVSVSQIVVFPILVIIITARIASVRIQKYRQAGRESTGRVTGFIGEIFSSIQLVKVANAEDRIVKQFRELNSTRRTAGLKDLLFNNVLSAIFGGLSTIGLGTVLIMVGDELRAGTFTAGDFALFQYYIAWVIGIPTSIGMFLIGSQQVHVSMERMQKMMVGDPPETLVENVQTSRFGYVRDEPRVNKLADDRLVELTVSGLTYTYADTNSGIRDINFTIRRGSSIVIAGRAGAGKTTLVRSVLGLLHPQQGKSYWNDQLIEAPDQFFVPPRSTFVPQLPHLYSDSVRDNILLGLPEKNVDLDTAIKRAAFENLNEVLKDGLDTRIGPRGTKLSGGQLQRVAIARMLVHGAEFVVVDDLSSALDLNTEAKLFKQVFTIPDTTFLIVSNRLPILRDADHVIVLDDGKISEEGKFDDVSKSSDVLQSILYSE